MNIIHSLAYLNIWAMLYFFIFEMKKVEDKLKS